MAQRSPKTIKKEIGAKRRELARAHKKADEAQAVLDRSKRHGAPRPILVDQERSFIALSRQISAIEREIRELEGEAFGPWAPKSWSNAS